MDISRRLLNAPEIVAATLILRRAFTRKELASIHGLLRSRAQQTRLAKRIEKERDLLGCIEQPGTFRLTLRVDSSPLFIPELANGDRSLAQCAVVGGILSPTELTRLEKLLRFQPASERLTKLITSVEIQLSKVKQS